MANPVKAEPARLLTMDDEKLEAIRAVADAADAKSIYKEVITLAELVLGDAVKEIDALRDALGNNQRALASEAQHAEDARRIAGEHQEARDLNADVATLKAEVERLEQEQARLTATLQKREERLEITTLYKLNEDGPVPIPPEARDEAIDGIFCRDAMIAGIKEDWAEDVAKLEAAERDLALARDAIRAHRDARGDDRCWMDDETLYKTLPEGYTPPERDSSVELARCLKFIEARHHPGTIYVSPQREIELLQSELRTERETLAYRDGMAGQEAHAVPSKEPTK